MKTTEEYLEDYFANQNELSSKGELWRLRVTQSEFLKEIERIRVYESNNKKSSHLNEYHIQRNVDAMIEIMLMDKVTYEEAKEQINNNNIASEEEFAEEAPEIRERLKLIQTPLTFRNIATIYRWLWRKQITIEMIPENVLSEFVKTKHYEIIRSRNEEESI
jgi:hypothetical protein